MVRPEQAGLESTSAVVQQWGQAHQNPDHFGSPYIYDEAEILPCSSHASLPMSPEPGQWLEFQTGVLCENYKHYMTIILKGTGGPSPLHHVCMKAESLSWLMPDTAWECVCLLPTMPIFVVPPWYHHAG